MNNQTGKALFFLVADNNLMLFPVYSQNVVGAGRSDVQPFPLSYRKGMNAVVTAQDSAASIHNVAGDRRERPLMFLNEGLIVVIGNEADLLTFLLPDDFQTHAQCDCPDLFLGRVTERKKDSTQFFLPEEKEKIGLILGIIHTPEKSVLPCIHFLNNPCIVTCCHIVAPQAVSILQQGSELDFPVTDDAGIGGSCLQIFPN